MRRVLAAALMVTVNVFGQAGNSVELEPAMMASVHVESVTPKVSRHLLTATGKIQFNDDQTVRVLAPLPGQLNDLKVRVGDSVKKDDVLFSIKSREVATLATDFLESQRDRDMAEKTFNMTKDLFDHQAASRISVQQAEADLAKSRTHLARAEESLRVLGIDPKQIEQSGSLRALIPVTAPVSGKVIERTAANGQFVQGDATPLLTITDPGSVWAFAEVFETDLHLVRPGQAAEITAVAYPNRKFRATVDRINDKLDPESRTIKVRLLVTNPDFALKPEMFITVALGVGSSPALTVAAGAVFTEVDKSFLFVQSGERKFERRLVTARPDGSGRMSVTSGLRAGERVVTDGALLLGYHQKNQQGGK